MTPAASILTRLEAAGLHLRVDGGNLIAGPREAVTDELRALMRTHKADLLAELQRRASDDGEDYTPADLVKMDDLLRQLAELEGWPAEVLTARLDERRRMAPVNVVDALQSLQAAVKAALALWPDRPRTAATVHLCRLVH